MTCDKSAVALLTFSPHEAKAWLYDLDQPDPTGGIMLCRKHANGTVVPMSWQLVDARDPAWPGPPLEGETGETGELVEAGAPLDLTALQVPSLPSDTAADDEFAGLAADLPITPQPYVPELVDAGVRRAPDPSLFELPLADIPAVTPYPEN